MPVNLHPRHVKIVGVPMDLGQQRRGVDMGPSAVRYAGLFDRLVRLEQTPSERQRIQRTLKLLVYEALAN